MSPSPFRRFAALLAAVACLATPLRGLAMCASDAMSLPGSEPACHGDASSPAAADAMAHGAPAPATAPQPHCDDMAACSVLALTPGAPCTTLHVEPGSARTALRTTQHESPSPSLEPPPPRA